MFGTHCCPYRRNFKVPVIFSVFTHVSLVYFLGYIIWNKLFTNIPYLVQICLEQTQLIVKFSHYNCNLQPTVFYLSSVSEVLLHLFYLQTHKLANCSINLKSFFIFSQMQYILVYRMLYNKTWHTVWEIRQIFCLFAFYQTQQRSTEYKTNEKVAFGEACALITLLS